MLPAPVDKETGWTAVFIIFVCEDVFAAPVAAGVNSSS